MFNNQKKTKIKIWTIVKLNYNSLFFVVKHLDISTQYKALYEGYFLIKIIISISVCSVIYYVCMLKSVKKFLKLTIKNFINSLKFFCKYVNIYLINLIFNLKH